jgi:uncharacterized protein DUF4832/uncharacterized protein DUF4874
MPLNHRKLRRLLTLTAYMMCLALYPGTAPADVTTITYAPDDQRDIANPERGLYLQFTSQAEQDPLNLDAVKALRDNNLTLTLRMYYLKTFRDRPLSDKQLNMIRDDFAIMREAGVKCVLRFAYTEKIGDPDAPIDIVLGHMDQLAPILKKNADVILTAQAGFVGAWGEGHASTNDLAEPENHNRIVQRWLDVLPPSRTVQLRTPRKKWMFLDSKTPISSEQAFANTPIARLGHHNDCFISSENDVGTYENIEAEKKYLAAETMFVPMGGETCAITKFADPENARNEMQNLHFTYLNLSYHPEVLKMWRTEGFFKEVKRRLGYRLTLDSLSAPQTAKHGGTLEFKLNLTNTGFAAPVNPRDVVLILKCSDTNNEYTLKIPVNPRTWLPGKQIRVDASLQLPDNFATGEYQLYLTLPDPEPTLSNRPDYMIQLANPGLWEVETGRHNLNATLRIK